VSHSGGIGGLLGDLCGDLGLEVPPLAPDTKAGLATILAGRGAAANPADITMHYQLDTFGEIVRLLLADPGFDALAIASTGENAARHVAAAVAESDKPVLFTWVGAIEGEGRETLRSGGVPSFLLPGRCATAMKSLVDFAAWRRMPAPAAVASLSEPKAGSPSTSGADPAGPLHALLTSIGIGLPAERICRSEKEAVASAEQFGYPVAVKGISPELTHKSDVGAVILGVSNADAVRSAFRSAVANLERAGGTVSGVLVQQMVDTRRGLELALGVIVDPSWGPVVMLALGGVGVEALGLASWRSCPVAESEVDGMIAEVRGLDRLLGQHRGRPALDRAALCRAVSGLSWVAADSPGLTMEVNPLVVLPAGEGVVALDVRVAR
jgi:acyl-CoA synthetase (NDP forming)